MDHQKVCALLDEIDAEITDLQGQLEPIDQELRRCLRHRSHLLDMLPPRPEGGNPGDTAGRRDAPRNGAPGPVPTGRPALIMSIFREAGGVLTTREIRDALIARGDGLQFPRDNFWRTIDAILRRFAAQGLCSKIGRATWTLPTTRCAPGTLPAANQSSVVSHQSSVKNLTDDC